MPIPKWYRDIDKWYWTSILSAAQYMDNTKKLSSRNEPLCLSSVRSAHKYIRRQAWSTQPTRKRSRCRTRSRFGILALLAAGTTINYLGRRVAGIAAPSMSHDLGLNPAPMGVIFSAFSWTYAASQIPGGLLLDRFGTKLTCFFAVTLWSLLPGYAATTTADAATAQKETTR